MAITERPALENVDKEIEEIYQKAAKFVDEKFPDERSGNRRISILALMKMLIALKSMRQED